MKDRIQTLGNHKYASNVIEKCLLYGDERQKLLMFDKILQWPEMKNG